MDVRSYFLLSELWKSTGRNYIGILVMGKMVEDGVALIFGKGMRVLGWEVIVCTILWEKDGKVFLGESCKTQQLTLTGLIPFACHDIY